MWSDGENFNGVKLNSDFKMYLSLTSGVVVRAFSSQRDIPFCALRRLLLGRLVLGRLVLVRLVLRRLVLGRLVNVLNQMSDATLTTCPYK